MVNIKSILLSIDPTANAVLKYLNNGHNQDGGEYFSGVQEEGLLVIKDLYSALRVVGFFGAVLMFLVCLIAFMTSGSAKSRDAAKTKMLWVLVGVFLLCLAVFIVGVIYSVGDAFT